MRTAKGSYCGRSVRLLFVASLTLAAQGAFAAPLTDLLAAVPPPPKDLATATTWIREGQIVAPEYLRFKESMVAERAAIGVVPAGAAAIEPDSSEPVEVQAAIRAYNAYLAANTGKDEAKAALSKRTRWVQMAMGGQLRRLNEKMAPCATPCTDTAALAQNQVLLERRKKLEEEELKVWAALFPDWQRSRGSIVATAQTRIAATDDGARAVGATAKGAIARYRLAMLDEIDNLLSITELTVKRIDAIERGSGYEPDAVSGASRSTKAKAKQ